MNNLLFLALLLIISIVICYYFYEAEKESFREIDGVKMWLDRCKTYNEMKVKINNPSCGVDDRCDHIKIGVKEDIVLDPSGEIKIEESSSYTCDPVNKTVIDLENKPKDLLTQDNFKIENMENMNSSEQTIEAQIKYCKDPARTCEDLGANCGYCDKGKLGSFKYTNRGSDGSGYKDSLGNISTDDGRPCEGDNWVYGDVEKCKKRRGQRACSQIKSCNDFEKYPGLDGLCGFCPTTGKAVPVDVIGEKNVPKYLPGDACVGGAELEKHITLNARQCTPFMNDNPCVRPQYWSGIPDHSPECYKKLYREAGGTDSNKDKDWWASDSKRGEFNMARNDLSADATMPNGDPLPEGYAPVPWLLTHFKNYADRIKDKCYSKANESWNWLTGYKYDPCVHQEETGYGNRECQRTTEGNTTDMLKTGTVSDYMNYYNIPHCDGFKNREGFINFEDWLNQNRPEILRKREANVWYQETKARAPDKFQNGGDEYKKYLKEIQQVMYSGKTYEKRLKATQLLKGLGHEPPEPPEIKEGDYVELIAKEHIYRGVLYRLKDFDGVKKALVMWDFYFNKNTNVTKNRGPTMGVCLKEHNSETHSEGDCIEGISAHLNNDTNVCENKSENKKLSCLVPTNFNVMTRGEQRYSFGYPQYPSIKATSPDNPFEDKGWVDVGYLTVLRRCKPSTEDCSSTDYNCETSLEAVNEYYKKPQDCDYDLSDYTECSKECGGGTQYRNFKINLPAKGEDALACLYGNNQRGYTERVQERQCNTHLCSPDAKRMVRLRWCGVGGEDDPNCVGINRYGGDNGVCYSMSPIDDIVHEGRKGDFMNIAKCRDAGGVWDAGNKLLNDGAHFYLDPVHGNSQDKKMASIYRFRWRPDNDGGQSFSQSIGLRKDYRDMCLHPNVNSIEIGGNEGVKWGRGDRSRFGPTHARNNNIGDNTRPNEWNGLGRIGDCNSPYAEIQIERMDKGDKFRLKRENFTGSIKEGWCNSPRESRRAQIPGRGHYMGVKLNAWEYGAASSEWDRFYKSEKESVHKFDCDMNPDTAEKRVGLFKCSGGTKDGNKYPFLTNNAFCNDIDPLRKSGFKDGQLICKEDCEPKGGTCNFEESEWDDSPYFVINADNSSSMHGASSRWRWSNSRIVLGGQGYKTGDSVSVDSPNSTRRAQGHPTWKNKAKVVPNINVREIKVEYNGKEQGWGNPTAGPRLVVWSGNRVIYDKYVGGNSRSRGGGKGILRASWGSMKKNTQTIPYTEFISGEPEVVTHAVLILREQGSGHTATVKNGKISFNPTASF